MQEKYFLPTQHSKFVSKQPELIALHCIALIMLINAHILRELYNFCNKKCSDWTNLFQTKMYRKLQKYAIVRENSLKIFIGINITNKYYFTQGRANSWVLHKIFRFEVNFEIFMNSVS
eukprot:TRINITY_DN5987_c1_g2_i5.p4 TRINITY_DN5987_c1_g2~~TRINITY_DN5987_c1_g2_i5.p4  ORF type:complete len:118 (-),score=3.09 TRINITY_DN5987_c1_g2_i5:822-1175(-)